MRSSTSRPPVSVDARRKGVSSPKTGWRVVSQRLAAIGSPAIRLLAMTVSRAMRITWSDSTGVSRPSRRRRLRVVAGIPSTLATSVCVEPTAATSFSSATNGKPKRTRDNTTSPVGHANRDRTSLSRGTAAGALSSCPLAVHQLTLRSVRRLRTRLRLRKLTDHLVILRSPYGSQRIPRRADKQT